MGIRTSSAAVRALRVRRSRDGGQSNNTLSYDDGSFSNARLSLNSRARLETSSTSAPTRLIVAGATSRPSISVCTATSCKGLPSSSTSYMHPPGPGVTPRPLVAFPCGSMSTTRILSPFPARYAARLMAVVLLPTPPFWFTMATIVLTAGILARRLSALLSERLAVSWPQFQTGEDTVLGSPGSFRGLRGFDLSHRPQGAWAPS